MQLPLVLLGAAAAAAPPPAPSAIFRNGDDGFDSYRIPALLVVPPPAPTPVDRSGTVGGAEETDTGSGTDSRPVGRSDAAASAGSSAEPPAAPPSSLSLYETLRGRARMPSRLVGTT